MDGDGRTPGWAPASWEVYRDGAASGAWNMALDHALAQHARAGVAVLRLYEWSTATVSLGRNEPARSRFGAVTAGAETSPGALGRFAWVRRPTGGRAVLHDRELTYAVVLPAQAFGGPRGTYRAVNAALVEGLRWLGAPVELAGTGRVAPLDSGPCFQAPAAGEIVAGGGKLVGSAQARLGEALLQHGSILLDSDQRELGSGSVAVSLRAFLGEVPMADVRQAVEEGFRRSFTGASWRSAGYEPVVLESAGELERARYGREEWTWRR